MFIINIKDAFPNLSGALCLQEGFSHIAFVVEDIEQAVQKYCMLLSVERPIIKQTAPYEQSQAVFRGAPTHARAKQSFFQFGEALRVELLEPDDCDSTWHESLQKSEGFHHAAFYVHDMQAAIKELLAMDMQVVQTGCYNGGKYAYLEAKDSPLMMLELLENDGQK